MTAFETLLVSNHDRPYGTFNLTLPLGALSDPVGKEGLAYLTGNLLLRGTQTRSYTEITDQVDHLGATLDVVVGREVSSLRADAVRRHLERVVDIAADVVSRPTFPEEELERLKRQTLAELRALRNHDEALARTLHHALLFDGHPYGRPAKGYAASLDSITRDDVAAFYAERVRRGGTIVASSGDIHRAELDHWLAHYFWEVADGQPAPVDFPAVPAPQGRTLLFIDKPERNQTQILLGHPCLHANHPDYFPLLVANTAFGGTFTSRVSQEIREKRGWSYGASADFAPSFRTGSFTMRYAPENENSAAALRLGLELLEDWVEAGLSEEEVAFAKAYRSGRFPFKIDTAQKRLEQALVGRLLGWPDDHLDHYLDRIAAVTKAQADEAVRRHICPQELVITVLGTADRVLDDLRRTPGLRRVIVHPYDEEWGGAPSPDTV